jgi:hypothetical protein
MNEECSCTHEKACLFHLESQNPESYTSELPGDYIEWDEEE